MTLKERNKLLPNIGRLSPVISIILFLLYIIFQKTDNIIYLIIVLGIIALSNNFIKNCVSRPLYKMLPVLNNIVQGTRPSNAMSCGLFLDGEIGNKTFGMPSGHSQIIWSVVTYILFKLWYIKYYKNENIKSSECILLVIISVILLGYSLYVSYSRVYIDGCHTLLQVIIGSLLGILISSIIIFFEIRIKL